MSFTNKFNSYFISHDTPRSIITPNNNTKIFFETFTEKILNGKKPKGILVISAHWEEDEFTIQTSPNVDVIYDFNNFPEEMYKLKYKAKTCKKLINRVDELFYESNLKLNKDNNRNMDHGCWIPMKMIYPNENEAPPIVQLSIKSNYDLIEHYECGKILRPLIDDGYLIFASGGSVHNLKESKDINYELGLKNPKWAKDFENWIFNTLTNKNGEERENELLNFYQIPNSKQSHPTIDHFLPLLIATGASNPKYYAKRIFEYWRTPVFSVSSYKFE